MTVSTEVPPQHPIAFVVTDDLKRSRLTVFFRLLLASPHLIWLELYSIVAMVVVFIAWIMGVLTGGVPAGLHNFLAGWLRYSTKVYAYVLLLADPFPPFSGARPYPVDVTVAPAEEQGRVSIFFRILLAIPALILSSVLRYVNLVVAFLEWFYCLVTGRASEGMTKASLWLLRYEIQTYGYVILLTKTYPSFGGVPSV